MNWNPISQHILVQHILDLCAHVHIRTWYTCICTHSIYTCSPYRYIKENVPKMVWKKGIRKRFFRVWIWIIMGHKAQNTRMQRSGEGKAKRVKQWTFLLKTKVDAWILLIWEQENERKTNWWNFVASFVRYGFSWMMFQCCFEWQFKTKIIRKHTHSRTH